MKRLEAMRADLREDVHADAAVLARSLDDKGEDITVSQHPADVASDLYAREELVSEQRALEEELALIEDALERVARQTYGICVDCGRAIPAARLEARPHAARCLECQRRSDRAPRR
jgi:DnaK suppressor protein